MEGRREGEEVEGSGGGREEERGKKIRKERKTMAI